MSIMKLVKAIIKPEQVEPMRKALFDSGFKGMTFTEVGGQRDQGGGVVTGDVQPWILLEIVVEYYKVDLLASTIAEWCQTGIFGDGHIYVMPVERAIRVPVRQTLEAEEKDPHVEIAVH